MITFRYEPLEYLLQNGLPELSEECWDHMDDGFYLDIFSPDWALYKEQEDNNRLGFIAMRENEKLIGYANVLINTDIHQEGLRIAVIHDIYITKKKRGYATKLFNYIEEFVKMMGVYRIDIAERLSFDKERGGVGKFYGSLGFRPMEIIHSKVINKESIV